MLCVIAVGLDIYGDAGNLEAPTVLMKGKVWCLALLDNWEGRYTKEKDQGQWRKIGTTNLNQ